MPVVSWLILAETLLGILLLAVDAGCFRKGRHRGEYVEKPWWRPTLYIDQVIAITFAEDYGRVGRFGDLDIDQADAAPLCIAAKTWLPGDP